MSCESSSNLLKCHRKDLSSASLLCSGLTMFVTFLKDSFTLISSFTFHKENMNISFYLTKKRSSFQPELIFPTCAALIILFLQVFLFNVIIGITAIRLLVLLLNSGLNLIYGGFFVKSACFFLCLSGFFSPDPPHSSRRLKPFMHLGNILIISLLLKM